jgi:hypothetical protein
VTASSYSANTPNKRAGEGAHERYPITAPRGNGQNLGPLRPGEDYLAVQAVQWYVNEQDGFLNDRLATGTAQIGIGDERYDVALGTYRLERGNRTAPIFDRSILPLRAYRGGDVTIRLNLAGIERANFVGGLLNEMAEASLDVVAGAVSAATVTGPAQALTAAGQTLVTGVKALFASGDKTRTIFDPQGFEFALRPDELNFKEVYILAHRGRQLTKLTVSKDDGGGHDVMVDGQPLGDGAWVLLRFWRSDRYAGPARPWVDSARAARDAIDHVLDELRLGAIEKEEAIRRLRPSGGQPPNEGDNVMAAVSLIAADYALTETESDSVKATLVAELRKAQREAEGGSPRPVEQIAEALSGQLRTAQATSLPLDHESIDPDLREAFTYAKRPNPELMLDLMADRELSRYAGGNVAGDEGGGYHGGNALRD